MSNDHQQKPLDMNEVFRGIAQEVVNANVGNQLANALIAAGNALRGQAFSMMSQINAQELLTQPALLSNGSSLGLLPYVRPVPGIFRLIATYSPSGERVLVAFIENEMETLKTGFLNIGDEQRAELNRQLDVLNFKNESPAAVEFGLLVVEKPVEGYEYFKAEGSEVIEAPAADVKVPEAGAPAVVAETPAAAPAAPVALDSVIGDVVPQA